MTANRTVVKRLGRRGALIARIALLLSITAETMIVVALIASVIIGYRVEITNELTETD